MKKLLFILIPFLGLSQIQISQDIDGEASGDQSGWSVSMSSDGSKIAIGAPKNGGNGANSGHVRIYENQGGVWTQIGDDINGENAEDQSGWSISTSLDGSKVAIGAPGNDGNGNNSGHVRIYENQGGIWTQIGDDINGEASGDQFGWSISMSSDGSIVAIGAPGNDGNGNNSGHVRIYENQSGTWVQIGDDINGEASGDRSGLSISTSLDGSKVAIGATGNDGNGNNSGHVRIYENQSGIWVQIGDDINGEVSNDVSGGFVSISSDGSVVAIGAPFNSDNGNNSGHVRIYKNESGIWTQVGMDIDGEGISDFSGISLSLSSDNSTVAIGAILNNDNGIASGHTRIFDLSDLLSVDNKIKALFNLYPNPTKNQFIIQLEDTTELENVNIYNNLGQLVLTSKETIINSSKLSAGLYIVKLETNKGKDSKKLIIK